MNLFYIQPQKPTVLDLGQRSATVEIEPSELG